ncbi:MAG: chaperonin GroEL [Anaerolineales bacterium]|nr:chaperonin GroEL [Anaerolineales bacterium]
MPRRSVVFQPATHHGIQQGMNILVNAVRPTLGPRPGLVAIDNLDYNDKTPKMFDDGGTIARHIIQLPDRDADMGAMLVRDLLWRLQQQVGDGTATAAVILQRVFNEGVRYLTAGGNAMQLKLYLDQGMEIILNELKAMTVDVEGKEMLVQIAESLCYDPELAKYMGEVFDIVGEWGRLEIREGHSRGVEREYTEGMYWNRGLLAREMYSDHSKPRVEYEDAAILISDLELNEPRQLYPALELAIRSKIPALLIVAEKISQSVIHFLVVNKDPEKFQAVVVRTPGTGREQRANALQDLAILTNGQPFISVAGETFEGINLQAFGSARRVWADYTHFGIIGGKGDPRELRQHIAKLRRAYENTEEVQDREYLQKRIGKLMGGTATLKVGGATEVEVKARVETAKRTATTLRLAMREGVLPGGGTALLDCLPALADKLSQSATADERAAYNLLIKALEEPFRTIVANAGYDSSDVMAKVRMAGSGSGFDVTTGEVVDTFKSGIYDATAVQKAVIYGAISTAAMALSIDVLIHRAEPEQAPLPKPAKRKQL